MHTLYTVPHRYHVPPVDGGVFCVLLRGCLFALFFRNGIYSCRKRVYTIITATVIIVYTRFLQLYIPFLKNSAKRHPRTHVATHRIHHHPREVHDNGVEQFIVCVYTSPRHIDRH